jgi:hypothetical protein
MDLQSSNNPSDYGENVTFTATVRGCPVIIATGLGVAPLDDPCPPLIPFFDPCSIIIVFAVSPTDIGCIPTGAVDFIDGETLLCDNVPLDLLGQATCSSSDLLPGSHLIVAHYLGDLTYAATFSDVLTQVVDMAATTTTLGSSANPVVHGQNVMWTASVASGSAVPTGSVQFKIDGNNFGPPVALNGIGQATSAISHPSTGAHIVRAFYLGSAGFLPSASAQLPQTVNKALTLTTVWTTNNPQNFGNPFTLHATVTPQAPGAGIPNGVLQFYVDGVKFGPLVQLNPNTGSTQLQHGPMARGNHTVKAMYQGLVNFKPSMSSNYTHHIN